jgi:hypothetical protein
MRRLVPLAGLVDLPVTLTPAEAAFAYASSGLAVFPLHSPSGRPGQACSCQDGPRCRNVGKHPRTEHGLLEATIDVRRVARWWRRWPNANIGLVTGDRFDVLDIDGQDGVATLRGLDQDLPLSGPVVQTGGGGWHYYLAPTGWGNAQPIRGLTKVDWRGRGGYVVAPPSRHVSGARYRWLRPLTAELPPVPQPLAWRLRPAAPPPQARTPAPVAHPHGYARRVLAAECAQLAATGRGGRNGRLWEATRNLYNFVAGGALDEQEVEAALLAAAACCGLLDEEPRQTRRTIQSGRRVGLAHPRGCPTGPGQTSRRPRMIRTESARSPVDGGARGSR